MKEKNPEKTILIESKWNLKDEEDDDLDCETVILIESKWNLKVFRKIEKTAVAKDINRIKVEFKGMISGILPTIPCNINRIKVEFKVTCPIVPSSA